MHTLKNDRIEINISELGAEIRKLTLDGKDVFWSGDPAIWNGVSPVLFPICGRLRDKKYIAGGKEYTMPPHGFAMTSTFTLESKSDTKATFLLTDNSETYKMYPWHFEFRITYILNETSVEVIYDVKNTSENTMYFSLGSHEAYACPEGIEDYDINFPQKETLNAWELDGGLLMHSNVPILKNSNVLPLYEKYFSMDTLVFTGINSRSATLKNRKTEREITVEFPQTENFLIWTIPGAPYVCLEPWNGIPPFVDEDYSIENKSGIMKLEANKIYHHTHTIKL